MSIAIEPASIAVAVEGRDAAPRLVVEVDADDQAGGHLSATLRASHVAEATDPASPHADAATGRLEAFPHTVPIHCHALSYTGAHLRAPRRLAALVWLCRHGRPAAMAGFDLPAARPSHLHTKDPMRMPNHELIAKIDVGPATDRTIVKVYRDAHSGAPVLMTERCTPSGQWQRARLVLTPERLAILADALERVRTDAPSETPAPRAPQRRATTAAYERATSEVRHQPGRPRGRVTP